MNNFKELKALCDYLEKKALEHKYSTEIAGLFQKVRDLKYEEKRYEEAKIAQWEQDFFNFVLEDGQLKPHWSGTNEKGEVIEYPTLENYDNKTYEYLIERLESTSNLLLKARYSNILWLSPKKHTDFAKIAIESSPCQ